MRKKGQIKFGESFGIIFIVTIVIFLGSSWYSSTSQKSMYQMGIENMEDIAFERYNYIQNHHFLRMSQLGITERRFDLNSFRVFKNFSNTNKGREYLWPQLGYSTVILEKYNYEDIKIGDFTINETIILYNLTPSSENLQRSSLIVYKSVIPLRNHLTLRERTDLGVLSVQTYIIH